MVACCDHVHFLDHYLLGKADPSLLDDQGFIRALVREANLLQREVGKAVGSKDVRARLLAATSIPWGTASERVKEEALDELAKLMAGLPTKFAPGVKVILDQESGRVVTGTHRAAGKRYKEFSVNPSFLTENERAVAALNESTSIFFSPAYEQRAESFRRRAQDQLASGLKQGLGNREIARDLQREFARTGLAESYWETVAAVHVNRARSFSALATYAENGVAQYEVVAVNDERTTVICQMMDGTILSVAAGLDAFAGFEDAKNLDEVKNSIAPFMRQSGNDIVVPSGRVIASVGPQGGFEGKIPSAEMNLEGINTPPYHYRCRTTVVPRF